MKRSGLAILCCFLLSACIFDPVFDTSSWDAYQRSLASIKAKLSNDDLRRLEIALKYLLIEATPKVELDGLVLTNAVATANLTNPNTLLARLGPRINGKSAPAIIQNLSIKLDTEISEAEARLQSEKAVGAIEIISPTYYWRRSGYLEQPIIEFSVRNAGNVPISRAYFRITLTSPNRSIPWAKQEFVQTFKGGLEPRERQQLSIPPRSGDWSDKQLRDVPNVELKVVVVNFEDANGQRVITVDSDVLDFKRKVRALLQ
jgi:hypothetical protein